MSSLLVTCSLIKGGVLKTITEKEWEDTINEYQDDSDYRSVWSYNEWDNNGWSERTTAVTIFYMDIYELLPDMEVAYLRRLTSETIKDQKLRLFGN